MIDIVIHVGLPKTATTLIQKKMSEFPNYVGLESAEADYTLELLNIYANYSFGMDVEEELKGWAGRISNYALINNIVAPLVVSSEFFFAGEFTGAPEFPLIDEDKSSGSLKLVHFIEFIAHSLRDKFKIRVLLTIRNQLEWLASKYAQAAPKIYNASQVDFERRIDRYSKLDNKFWCDWGGAVQSFDEAIGRDNVTVLCMEDMGKEDFWESLSLIFTGTTYSIKPGKSSTNALASVNKKRRSLTEWSCGAFEFGSCLAKKYRAPPGSLKHRLIVRSGNILSRIGLVSDSRREDHIFLSTKIKSQVGSYCARNNLWLEKRLNKDLREIGYPVLRVKD
jgi:hypothetical protein